MCCLTSFKKENQVGNYLLSQERKDKQPLDKTVKESEPHTTGQCRADVGSQRKAPERTDSKGCSTTEQTPAWTSLDQPGQGHGRDPWQRAAGVFTRHYALLKSLQFKGILASSRKTRLSHFRCMNIVGRQQEGVGAFIQVSVN